MRGAGPSTGSVERTLRHRGRAAGSCVDRATHRSANLTGVNQEHPADKDWVSQALDTLERVIDTIRSKTSEPLLKVVQTIVFGMLAAGLAITMLLLITIGGVRMLDAYLPQGVWLAYFVMGSVLILIGLVAWRKRHRPQA